MSRLNRFAHYGLSGIVAAGLISQLATAGVPVVDLGANTLLASNLAQTTSTATESIAQTLKQIQQYATQLEQLQSQYEAYARQGQQLENMVKNTVAPAAYIWNEAQSVMARLRQATDTLAYYKNQTGSVDAYLAKFQDVNYYRNSPCYGATGCSQEEMARMNSEASKLGSEAQKKANDALLKGLDQQQEAIQTDAGRLQNLQANAQTAQGQMEAIGYASQLAAEQVNQSIQIRGLLVAQQNAIATKMQADADKEARLKAGDELFLSGSVRQNSGKRW